MKAPAEPSPAPRVPIERLLAEFGLTPAHARLAALTSFAEAATLVPAAGGRDGNRVFLTPAAAAAWAALAAAAEEEGVALELISGFRSHAYQAELIRRQQAAGRALEDILRSVAPPGFSEHHTGEAVDIGSPGAEDLTAAFGESAACAWLQARAGGFGWTMSYPAGNRYGFIYEPWHWKWHPTPLTP